MSVFGVKAIAFGFFPSPLENALGRGKSGVEGGNRYAGQKAKLEGSYRQNC